jgi:RND superfamily putative drug exporter
LGSKGRLRLIFAAWLVAAIAAIPFAANVENELDSAAKLPGSESARVEDALQQRFKSPFTKLALLRVAGAPEARTDAGRQFLKEVADTIRGTPGIQGVISYADRNDSLYLGEDGSSIVVVGLSASERSGEAIMERLRRATEALRLRAAGRYPDLTLGWTGEVAVNADVRRLSGHETRVAEMRVLPITLVLLLVGFRSLVAAVLPLVCGGLAVVVSLASIAIMNKVFPASIIVVSVISMVGLGLSIDYALLIVSRYRDAVHEGESRAAAVKSAADHGGRTILVSGSAVAIGFGALLLVPESEVRSIGMGGLLVTTMAVLVALTLLPVLLAWLGPLVEMGQVRLKANLIRAKTSKPNNPGGRGHWRRWATWVAHHPLSVLLVGGVPLLLLAAQSAHLRVDLPRGRWLPASADSVRVLQEIDSTARGNFGQIIQIVLELPPGLSVRNEAGWRAESRLVRYFARDPRIQHVWAVTTLSVAPMGGPEILARIPESVRSSLLTADGRGALIQLLPRRGVGASEAEQLVRDIRAAGPRLLAGLAGATLEVGGLPAFNLDYEDTIKHSVKKIVASVVCVTLLVFALAFRSVLIPLKAVALNLLSVAAAFGAVAVVFQSGLGSRLVGLSQPLDGGFPIVPVLVFCIVFGLSMDYEVFIVARIAEGRRAGLTDAAALIEGIAGTGRVITLAAAIMVTIFTGFVFGNFVLIKLLGFALAAAVFFDATLIRVGLGPALIQLAGRWNWWPGR